MTILNFLKEHQTKLKTTKKMVVRDLDELEKNKFVAYVDEENESFDVQLELDAKKNIKDSSCDCSEGGICNHIVALVQFISGNKVEKTTIKKGVKRKLSETDQLLETLDNETIRLWVSDILNKNKELAFGFKNHFGKNEIILDKETIEKSIQDSISSIIGRRKKVETNEVKKIVDALTVSLKPILEQLFSKTTKENYQLFNFLVQELGSFNFNYYTNSTRIQKYINTIYIDLLKSVFNIKEIEEWQKSVHFYLSLIFEDKFYMQDLDFAKKIYDFSIANELQKMYVIQVIEENIEKLYKNYTEEYPLFSIELEYFILTIFSENNLFEKHATKFKPRRFQNNHNLLLINELLKINQNKLAEKYCIEQIESNYKQEYDLPYAKILISIYKQNNEIQKLENILSDYGKNIFSIDD